MPSKYDHLTLPVEPSMTAPPERSTYATDLYKGSVRVENSCSIRVPAVRDLRPLEDKVQFVGKL